jgi:ubiquinol-cytochrome c reductase iron-sulfur subunit
MTNPNDSRRRFLITGTSFLAGAAVVGIAVPFVQSWNPSAKAKASGAPIKIDVSKIEAGAMVTLEWQGKPVWVLRRTEENIENLQKVKLKNELRDPDSEMNMQPAYAQNDFRSIRPEIFVAVGVCTHLGCIPLYKPEGIPEFKDALYFCPCHGSKYDLAGRVFKNVPAPTNLIIPPYHYLSEPLIEVGIDESTTV